MAMYANVLWKKVANMAQQPVWFVYQTVWDEQGNIVLDENNQPVLVAKLVSPPGIPSTAKSPPPTPTQQNIPPLPVVHP